MKVVMRSVLLVATLGVTLTSVRASYMPTCVHNPELPNSCQTNSGLLLADGDIVTQPGCVQLMCFKQGVAMCYVGIGCPTIRPRPPCEARSNTAEPYPECCPYRYCPPGTPDHILNRPYDIIMA